MFGKLTWTALGAVLALEGGCGETTAPAIESPAVCLDGGDQRCEPATEQGTPSATCIDECTQGARECSEEGWRLCGEYDEDACLDWSPVTACPEGQTCSLGTCAVPCTDECSTEERECVSDGWRLCGEYDEDACLDWSSVTTCAEGQTCSLGACAASCTDECRAGERQCFSDGWRQCGQYDQDSCLEWSPRASCAATQACDHADGTCRDLPKPATPSFSKMTLFSGGSAGYHSFRIPSLVRAKSGALIAFAEGRKNGKEDYGDIDIVMRRSTDHGKTWSPIRVVFSKLESTCGNPTAVLDEATGAIWLFASWNEAGYSQRGGGGYTQISQWGDRRVYSMVSRDDGATFGELQNRTSELVPRDYAWDAVGPGIGVQIVAGAFKGRLLIPAIGRNIYSDDHGATWKYQLLGSKDTSEGTIVERMDGRLLRNDRPVRADLNGAKRRAVSTSTDSGGTGWSAWRSDGALPDPICQASILRYNRDFPARLVFLNPASESVRHPMRVRISYNDGATWSVRRDLDADRGGYSSMIKTADFHIGALTESGPNASGAGLSIAFSKFNLGWLEN